MRPSVGSQLSWLGLALVLATPVAGHAEPSGGPLGFVVDPVGAEIVVDGRTLGRVPLRPVRLEPGLHTVVIRAPGHVPVTRTLEIRPRTEVTLAVVLVPAASRSGGAPQSSVDRPPERRGASRTDRSRDARSTVRARGSVRPAADARAPRSSHRPEEDRPRDTPVGRGPLLWIGFGSTIALTAGAVVTGALALSGESEYREPDTSEARRRVLDKQIRELATVTDVLVDGAIALGLATVALFLLGGPDDDAARQFARTPRAGETPRAGAASHGGLGELHWAF